MSRSRRSNARFTLRVTFEEILGRFEDIQIASGEQVRRRSVPPFLWYVLEEIPVAMRARSLS